MGLITVAAYGIIALITSFGNNQNVNIAMIIGVIGFTVIPLVIERTTMMHLIFKVIGAYIFASVLLLPFDYPIILVMKSFCFIGLLLIIMHGSKKRV